MQIGNEHLRVLKDIGCGVHMQADIPDTSKVFISVGLGFYPEVTLPEACAILRDRQETLQGYIEQDQQQLAKVKANIELIQDGLQGLRALVLAEAEEH